MPHIENNFFEKNYEEYYIKLIVIKIKLKKIWINNKEPCKCIIILHILLKFVYIYLYYLYLYISDIKNIIRFPEKFFTPFNVTLYEGEMIFYFSWNNMFLRTVEGIKSAYVIISTYIACSVDKWKKNVR